MSTPEERLEQVLRTLDATDSRLQTEMDVAKAEVTKKLEEQHQMPQQMAAHSNQLEARLGQMAAAAQEASTAQKSQTATVLNVVCSCRSPSR